MIHTSQRVFVEHDVAVWELEVLYFWGSLPEVYSPVSSQVGTKAADFELRGSAYS